MQQGKTAALFFLCCVFFSLVASRAFALQFHVNLMLKEGNGRFGLSLHVLKSGMLESCSNTF